MDSAQARSLSEQAAERSLRSQSQIVAEMQTQMGQLTAEEKARAAMAQQVNMWQWGSGAVR